MLWFLNIPVIIHVKIAWVWKKLTLRNEALNSLLTLNETIEIVVFQLRLLGSHYISVKILAGQTACVCHADREVWQFSLGQTQHTNCNISVAGAGGEARLSRREQLTEAGVDC